MAGAPGLTSAVCGEYARKLSGRVAFSLQVELANQMGVAQPEICRIEKCHDMLLSTLTNYLCAAGGHPRAVATVNGQDVELDLTTLVGAR